GEQKQTYGNNGQRGRGESRMRPADVADYLRGDAKQTLEPGFLEQRFDHAFAIGAVSILACAYAEAQHQKVRECEVCG
ncbi:MAG: hypothetical protein JWN14_4150, partial [Chthonomonadales bacterium]|nr:hypothetical protein [Chthonomonadales bacterium]